MGFPPGVSGNPSGRKKGSGNALLTKYMKAGLQEVITVNIGTKNKPKKVKMTRGEKIARAMLSKAENGSMQTADFIAERCEGKIKDVHEIRDRREELSTESVVELAGRLKTLSERIALAGSQRPGAKRRNTRRPNRRRKSN